VPLTSVSSEPTRLEDTSFRHLALLRGSLTSIQAQVDNLPASPSEPYKPKGPVLSDWKRFLTTKKGEYGQARLGFQYNYNTLKGYLTPQYGGHRTGGGGGDNEFEIVLRLLAGF